MLTPAPKPPARHREPEYLAYVATQPCVACRSIGIRPRPADPHHVQTKGAGGGDDQVAPLCREHHAMCHRIGRASFAAAWKLDLDAEAARVRAAWLALPAVVREPAF